MVLWTSISLISWWSFRMSLSGTHIRCLHRNVIRIVKSRILWGSRRWWMLIWIRVCWMLWSGRIRTFWRRKSSRRKKLLLRKLIKGRKKEGSPSLRNLNIFYKSKDKLKRPKIDLADMKPKEKRDQWKKLQRLFQHEKGDVMHECENEINVLTMSILNFEKQFTEERKENS